MSAADMEREKQAIWRHMAELEAAENRKDIAGILELLTEDFVLVFSDSKIEGKATMAEWMKESAKHYVSSKHVPLRVEVAASGEVAWLLGYELNRRQRSEDIVETKQYYVITFRKAEGEWKEVAVCIA